MIKQNLLKVKRLILRQRKNRSFHDDKTLQGFIRGMIEMLPITSFVETGTRKGDSVSYVAKNYPNLPIFTCELNTCSFLQSWWSLGEYKNISCFRKSSPDFLRNIISRMGDLPLFFLDAHMADWEDNYYPLREELEIISNLERAIIIIDDIKTINNVETLELDKKNKYHILSSINPQVEYVVVFQNMGKEFEDFKKLEISKQYKDI